MKKYIDENGKDLKETPMPPKTPCTCPHEWATSRMEIVKKLIESYRDATL